MQAKKRMYEAGTFRRLCGGVLLISFVDDGQELLQPLDQKRIHKIVSLQTHDRHQVSFEDNYVHQDIHGENFGKAKAEIYNISQPKQGCQTDEEHF